jgi:hypothetical protein
MDRNIKFVVGTQIDGYTYKSCKNIVFNLVITKYF